MMLTFSWDRICMWSPLLRYKNVHLVGLIIGSIMIKSSSVWFWPSACCLRMDNYSHWSMLNIQHLRLLKKKKENKRSTTNGGGFDCLNLMGAILDILVHCKITVWIVWINKWLAPPYAVHRVDWANGYVELFPLLCWVKWKKPANSSKQTICKPLLPRLSYVFSYRGFVTNT